MQCLAIIGEVTLVQFALSGEILHLQGSFSLCQDRNTTKDEITLLHFTDNMCHVTRVQLPVATDCSHITQTDLSSNAQTADL